MAVKDVDSCSNAKNTNASYAQYQPSNNRGKHQSKYLVEPVYDWRCTNGTKHHTHKALQAQIVSEGNAAVEATTDLVEHSSNHKDGRKGHNIRHK